MKKESISWVDHESELHFLLFGTAFQLKPKTWATNQDLNCLVSLTRFFGSFFGSSSKTGSVLKKNGVQIRNLRKISDKKGLFFQEKKKLLFHSYGNFPTSKRKSGRFQEKDFKKIRVYKCHREKRFQGCIHPN